LKEDVTVLQKNMEKIMALKHKSDPIIYQGKNKNENYFEGWYFKHVSSDLNNVLSIIPGISKNKQDSHAFIQVILLFKNNGKLTLKSHYFKFLPKEFEFIESPFSLIINRNIFSRKGIKLNLIDDEYTIEGSISYSDFADIRRNILSPNAMGFFAYMPFMECYHDIISMNHDLTGNISINNLNLDFNNGKGYIEKDCGISFPKEYIWLQSNHFDGSNASIMFSLAHIPFLGTAVQGFICNLAVDGKEYRFATYNKSKIIKTIYGEGFLEFIIIRGNYKLVINAGISQDIGLLRAPANGLMNVPIKEGLSGDVYLKLFNGTRMLFKGSSKVCAIEIQR